MKRSANKPYVALDLRFISEHLSWLCQMFLSVGFKTKDESKYKKRKVKLINKNWKKVKKNLGLPGLAQIKYDKQEYGGYD